MAKSKWSPKAYWTSEKKEEMRKKMQAKFRTPEMREKMAEVGKKYWSEHDHPMKGQTFSPEARARMKEGQKRYRESLRNSAEE